MNRDPLHKPERLRPEQQDELQRMFGRRYHYIQPNAGVPNRKQRRALRHGRR